MHRKKEMPELWSKVIKRKERRDNIKEKRDNWKEVKGKKLSKNIIRKKKNIGLKTSAVVIITSNEDVSYAEVLA